MIDENYPNKYHKAITLLIAICIIFLLTFMIIVNPVSATIDVYGYATNSAIYFNWSDASVNSISVDGNFIENFDNKSLSYSVITYGEMYPINHTLKVYSATDSGMLSVQSITPKSIENDLWLHTPYYIALVLGFFSVITAMLFSRVIGFIGLAFGAYITMLSFYMDGFALITGIIIVIASIVAIFNGRGI